VTPQDGQGGNQFALTKNPASGRVDYDASQFTEQVQADAAAWNIVVMGPISPVIRSSFPDTWRSVVPVMMTCMAVLFVVAMFFVQIALVLMAM
jgi:hypothetical protein